MLYQLSYSRSRGPTAIIEAAGLWGVKQAGGSYGALVALRDQDQRLAETDGNKG